MINRPKRPMRRCAAELLAKSKQQCLGMKRAPRVQQHGEALTPTEMEIADGQG